MEYLERLAYDISSSGIRNIFGIPGSGPCLTLLDALSKHGVSFHLTHFEGSAILMAGVQGRLTGRSGVAVGIKGPGLANMVPGLAACSLEAFPVVSITEAYTPEIPLSKAHKRLDHEGLVSAVAKGRRFLSENGPGFKEMARWAEAEVPGPVHMDISGQPVSGDEPVPAPKVPGIGMEEGWERVKKLITHCERPVIIAGTLAVRKGWAGELNRLNIPVFTTAAAKGSVDETFSPAAGVYTGAGLELTPEKSILPHADMVIGLGLRTNEVLSASPFQCTAVNIDPVGKSCCPGFDFQETVSDFKDQMSGFFAILRNKSWGLDLVSGSIGRMRDHLLAGPFMPAHAFYALERQFQHQARLVLDTGHFCTIGEHVWRALSPDLCLGAGQGRYMGTGLPMAVGAALLDSRIPTIAVLGDGGIGMFVSEVKLAVAKKVPLLIVLMTDGYLGSIRTRALKDSMDQGPVTITMPSWLNVFESFDMPAGRAESDSELETLLSAWQPENGPMYLELAFDPDLYQVMGEGIR